MDTYQAIYDAVRSRMGSCDIAGAVERVLYSTADFGSVRQIIAEQASSVGFEMVRPSVLYRPALLLDGTKWCALYGENLMDGVAGFGDTPSEAMVAFDKAWSSERTPCAVRATTPAGAERDDG